MKRNGKKQRLFSLFLALCLVATALPLMSITAYGASSNLMMQLGTAVLSTDVNTDNAPTVYFGWYDDNPVAWKVIGYEGNEVAGASGNMTLITRGTIESTEFNPLVYQTKMSIYADSDLQKKMDTIANHLSAEEKRGITPRTLASGVYNKEEPEKTDCVRDNPVKDALLWPLSIKEANAMNQKLRKADLENSTLQDSEWYNERWLAWWLRSPGKSDSQVSFVDQNGIVNSEGRMGHFAQGVRPAFHLNLSSVLFTSAAKGGKSTTVGAVASQKTYNGNEWKLTLLDSNRNGFSISHLSKSDKTLSFQYSGAKAGDYEYISAYVQKDTTKVITQYGKLTKVSSQSGTVEIDLPALKTGETLYIINEQDNGDKKTDYASAPQRVELEYLPTSITKVDISGVAIPAAGATPDYDVVVPTDAKYEIAALEDLESLGFDENERKTYTKGIRWVNDTDHVFMNPSDKFETGKRYHIETILIPKIGYVFSDSLKGTINKNMNLFVFDQINSQKIGVGFALLSSPIYIAPTYTVKFDSNGGTGSMTDVTEVSGIYTLPKNGFTEPSGKQFKGWSLSFDGTIINRTTITVNADTTLYAIWEEVPSTEITLKNITNIGISNVPTPVAGKPCLVEDITVTTLPENGVKIRELCWFDETDGKNKTGTDTFIQGHKYSISFLLAANLGYSFEFVSAPTSSFKSYNGTVTINGEKAQKAEENPSGSSLLKLLGKPAMPTVIPMEIPTTYTLNTMVAGGYGTIVPTGTKKAVKGETETILFKPDEGYEIDKVTVNGVETKVTGNILQVKIDEDKTIVVSYKKTTQEGGTAQGSGTAVNYKVMNEGTKGKGTVIATGGTGNKTELTSLSIPDTVTMNGKLFTVTAIADDAFKDYRKLTTITIGKNVQTIGANAFKNCKALTKVTIGNKVTAIGKSCFEGCSSLKLVMIGKNVKTIGKNAFKNCKKLTSIRFRGTKLKKVGANAFKGIHAKCKIKAPKSKLRSYKSLLSKKGQVKTVKVSK